MAASYLEETLDAEDCKFKPIIKITNNNNNNTRSYALKKINK